MGYTQFANFISDSIEAKGIAPLKPQLDAIAAIASKADYAELVGRNFKLGVPGPIFMGQRLFIEELARAFTLISDFDNLVKTKNPKHKAR